MRTPLASASLAWLPWFAQVHARLGCFAKADVDRDCLSHIGRNVGILRRHFLRGRVAVRSIGIL